MISIIIVNYNSGPHLKKCLKSLASFVDNSYEIFVVDNNSIDKSADNIKSEFSFAGVIYNSKNIGFAKANNQAYKISKGDLILFLNPDVEISKDSIETMANYLLSDNSIGAVGPRFVDEKNIERNQKYYQDIPEALGALQYYFKFMRHKIPLADKTTFVGQIPGACLMVKREVFQRVGMFDENYFVWMEDVDLCLRIKKSGFQLAYLPNVSVKHVGGVSFKTLKNGERGLIWAKSNIHFFFKNKSFAEAILFIVLFFPKVLQFYILRALNR